MMESTQAGELDWGEPLTEEELSRNLASTQIDDMQGRDEEDQMIGSKLATTIEINGDIPKQEILTSWGELNLPEPFLTAIAKKGWVTPTPIQSISLPYLIQGVHFIGQAQAGTGKTGAFVLTVLNSIQSGCPNPQAVIVSPTRELCIQNFRVVEDLNVNSKFSVALCIPVDKGERRDRNILDKNIIVATPGTLKNLLTSRNGLSRSKNIRCFVLDEADVMLSQQGQKELSVNMIRLLNKDKCQLNFFSATYDEEVRKFASELIRTPPVVKMTVPEHELTVENCKQYYINCQDEDARIKMLDIMFQANVGSCIIFCETRNTARKLTQKMTELEFEVGCLTGGLGPSQRDEVLDSFRLAETRLLVATNVLSRGIDVLSVSLVINYDVPITRQRQPDYETYLHRVGRSGRAGTASAAITLILPGQKTFIDAFESKYNPYRQGQLIPELTGEYLNQLSLESPEDLTALLSGKK